MVYFNVTQSAEEFHDMNEKSLRILEYDKIIANRFLEAGFALTDLAVAG